MAPGDLRDATFQAVDLGADLCTVWSTSKVETRALTTHCTHWGDTVQQPEAMMVQCGADPPDGRAECAYHHTHNHEPDVSVTNSHLDFPSPPELQLGLWVGRVARGKPCIHDDNTDICDGMAHATRSKTWAQNDGSHGENHVVCTFPPAEFLLGGGLPPPPPAFVKQDKSSGGSVDMTETRSGPQRVRMSSGERPIGAAKANNRIPRPCANPPPPPLGC